MKEYWNDLSRIEQIKYIVGGVAGIIVVIFAVLNWHYTRVHLIVTTVQIPITLIVLMSVAGGFGFASLFDYRKFKKKDAVIKRLRKELTEKGEDKSIGE